MKSNVLQSALWAFFAHTLWAQPIVTSITPSSAIPGSLVTVLGIGFDGSPSNNTVEFGDVAVTVSSATTTKLEVAVPSGLIGPVSLKVTVGSQSSPSKTNFTIINPESGGAFSVQQTISTQVDGPWEVYSADLDGDGDMDVLSASIDDDKIAWYENTDGKGTFSDQKILNSQADAAWSVFAADIDGDGDEDVLSAQWIGDKITWYENTDGLGNFSASNAITNDPAGITAFVRAADLDGDGDMDVLSASLQNDEVVWYNNTDGLGTFSAKNLIDTQSDGSYTLDVADLDGDGDMDVMSASVNADQVAWYENTDGLGTFSAAKIITTQADGANFVQAADIDGDGDLDVLSTSEVDDKVAWYKNENGLGNFSSQIIISEDVVHPISVKAFDFDGDGDLDVVSGSSQDNKVAWYENMDGLGNFSSQKVIGPSLAVAPAVVHGADLDGDGDMDLIVASGGDGDEIVWFENQTVTGVFQVNSTGDTEDFDTADGLCQDDQGNCTLRAAIEQANALAGMDTIIFDIAGAGPHTIQPNSALPIITDPVIIDGTTEPDFAGTPIVELDGTSAGVNTRGLHLTTGNSTVKGLVINRFEDGIFINGSGATGNLVQGNYIGTDVTGTVPLGNSVFGVQICCGAHENIIGGSSELERNLISANEIGIWIINSGTERNKISGNFIGTDITGTIALGNKNGVFIVNGARFNIVGGITAAERNIISGNGQEGVVITDSETSFNKVIGNFIGTDLTGSNPIGNKGEGVAILNKSNLNFIGTDGDGEDDLAERNIISGNGNVGVVIAFEAEQNVVAGNFIGLDVSGAFVLPNGSQGGVGLFNGAKLNLIGTNADGLSDDLERNIISGNEGPGIRIYDGEVLETEQNTISGNYIGTDVTGTVALANANEGVSIAQGAQANTIGGTTAAERNIISGNGQQGVIITNPGTDLNKVIGNFIGTDVTGTVALGNAEGGVTIRNFASNNTIGGVNDGEGNLISGNGQSGISISSDSNTILGNYVGTDVTGTIDLGNIENGVRIVAASDNTVGGTNASARNIISGNDLGGVYITLGGNESAEAAGNLIQGNYIGTDVNGTAAIGNDFQGVQIFGQFEGVSDNVVGGAAEGARNIISASGWAGVFISGIGATANVVQGNFIGTDTSGTADLGNFQSGVVVFQNSSQNQILQNLIGHSKSGIHLTENVSKNIVSQNEISFDSLAVLIDHNSSDNVIGGNTAEDGNTIANNERGIHVADENSTNNQILFNLFRGNVSPAIDLGADGVTANDSSDIDTGPNQLQNFPEVTTLDITENSIEISYWVDSDSASSEYPLLIQFFKSDSLGNGEVMIGTDTFALADFTDGSKLAAFEVDTLRNGDYVVATATDDGGNTSEFSPMISIGPVIALDVTSLDFGEVVLEEPMDMTITISNPGNGKLFIPEISTDNPLFAVDKDSLFLGLGESGEITVTFSPDSVLEQSGILSLETNLEDIEIPLSGIGVEPVGLANELLSKQISLYPNPTNGEFELSLSSNYMGNVSIRVMAISGQVYLTDKFYKGSLGITHRIDLSAAPMGVYLVQIQTHNALTIKRMVRYH